MTEEERRIAARQKANANLIPKGHKFTKEDMRKGAMRANEVRRQKKTIAQITAKLLERNMTSSVRQVVEKVTGEIDAENDNLMAAIAAGQIASALKGNSMAAEWCATQQKVALELTEKAEKQSKKDFHIDLDIIADSFHPVIRDVRNHGIPGHRLYGGLREYILEGGRMSTKSTVNGCVIPEIMLNNKQVHALVMRKVGNTLKDSVYTQIKWALDKMDIEELFDDKKNPLEITIKQTGQKIYFRGADDPGKIKSIKPAFGYIGIVWYEELDQFSGEDEIRKINQSAIRGGDLAWVFKSFNPPKSKNNWANMYVERVKAENNNKIIVHHSTYLDIPEEWLGQAALDEIEHIKATLPEAYEHEYLGIPNGEGGMIFNYIEKRTITDEEINGFDMIFQGVDWGLDPDPFVFVRMHYDTQTETIYFIDEYTARGLRNVQTAEEIINRGYNDYSITCDSAEKKSVLDFRDLGINAKAAKKGAGSVEYGMKWLALRKIVIDPQRTPFVYKEFTEYEHERTKDGEIVSGYPDHNNHSIDATRYALEKFCNKRCQPA